MVQVFYGRVLDAAPEDVWNVVGDFAALSRWFPFITMAHPDTPATLSDRRELRLAGGQQ